MRTFVLSAVILTSDDAPVTPWSDRVVEAELHDLAAKWLPGQAIVSDVALTEVGREVPEDVAEAATVEVPLTETTVDPWSMAEVG